MFGSASMWRNPWNGFIGTSSTGASAVASTTSSPPTFTVIPSACASRSSISVALISIAPAASASSTVYDRASSTAATAQSTGRPRSSAIDVIWAIVSLRTLRPRSPSMSSPCPLIGVAAPTLVAGAIAARCAASVMNVPALAACAPEGPTHTMTGSGASNSAWTMSRVASSEPPGVSSWMTTAGAPSAAAFAMPSRR